MLFDDTPEALAARQLAREGFARVMEAADAADARLRRIQDAIDRAIRTDTPNDAARRLAQQAALQYVSAGPNRKARRKRTPRRGIGITRRQRN